MSRFTPAAADRRLPWDVMGKNLTGMDHASVADALTASGLDYDVEVWNLQGTHPTTGQAVAAPSLRTLVRPMPDGTTKVLAASGTRYTPIQNRDSAPWRTNSSQLVAASSARRTTAPAARASWWWT